MDLSEIIMEVGELSVRSNAIQSNVRSYINRAQKQVAGRRNWTFMKDVIRVEMESGKTEALLPPTFKSLTGERTPVTVEYAGYNIPVEVKSKAEVARMGIAPWVEYEYPVAVPGSAYPLCVVFLDRRADQWTLNIPQQGTNVAPSMFYKVSGYFYPADLIQGTDNNAFTNDGNLGEAIVSLAKAFAYFAEDVSSPLGLAAKELYEDYFLKALYSDTTAELSGRTLRM